MNDHLALILTAVVAGVVAVIAVLFSGVKRYLEKVIELRIKRLDRSEYANGFQLYAEVDQVIEGIRNLPYVDRVITFNGQNGGGKPTPGEKYTVQAFNVFSKVSHDIPDVYKFIYNVDSYYCMMLQKMIQDGYVVNETKSMPEGAVLRNLYLEEGVVCSILYFVCLSDNTLTFISVGSYKENFTAPQIAKIELFVARLRALMARVQ